jgi:hypothetical protein
MEPQAIERRAGSARKPYEPNRGVEEPLAGGGGGFRSEGGRSLPAKRMRVWTLPLWRIDPSGLISQRMGHPPSPPSWLLALYVAPLN